MARRKSSVRSIRPSLQPRCQSAVCTILMVLPLRLLRRPIALVSAVPSCPGRPSVTANRGHERRSRIIEFDAGRAATVSDDLVGGVLTAQSPHGKGDFHEHWFAEAVLDE